jgi:serine/threonine protein kinase
MILSAPYSSLLDIHNFRQRLLREVRVWSGVNHPNITPLLGISYDFDRPNTPCLVSPYYLHGSIINYLQECPNANKLQLVSHIVRLIRDLLHNFSLSLYRLLRHCRICIICP